MLIFSSLDGKIEWSAERGYVKKEERVLYLNVNCRLKKVTHEKPTAYLA
jgi:hypothetical protein